MPYLFLSAKKIPRNRYPTVVYNVNFTLWKWAAILLLTLRLQDLSWSAVSYCGIASVQ